MPEYKCVKHVGDERVIGQVYAFNGGHYVVKNGISYSVDYNDGSCVLGEATDVRFVAHMVDTVTFVFDNRGPGCVYTDYKEHVAVIDGKFYRAVRHGAFNYTIKDQIEMNLDGWISRIRYPVCNISKVVFGSVETHTDGSIYKQDGKYYLKLIQVYEATRIDPLVYTIGGRVEVEIRPDAVKRCGVKYV